MREAPTIVLIGAGSTSFGLSTLHDLYADPVFTGATDLARRPRRRARSSGCSSSRARSRRRRGAASPCARRPIAPTRCPAPTRSSCRSRSIATGAGSRTSRSRAAHGVEHVLGENAGPGGLAHALRTIPLVAEHRARRRASAPDALLINFTNPEGRICTAFRRHLDQPIIGLCHEVELARRRFSQPARADDRVPGRRPQPSHRARRRARRDDRRRRHRRSARRRCAR